MRLLRTSLLLAVLLMLPFVFWGDVFTSWFTGDAAARWIRERGAWGQLAVLGLLISDLFLPVPATGVMSAAGYVYGWWAGGWMSAGGSFLAGLFAYELCRRFGKKIALRLVGEAELARGQALFERSGPWLIALSRWLPLLPEVTTCLAGLVRMRRRTFMLALACGCLPMGFSYAAIGSLGQGSPRFALLLSVIVPGLLWLAVQPILAASDKSPA